MKKILGMFAVIAIAALFFAYPSIAGGCGCDQDSSHRRSSHGSSSYGKSAHGGSSYNSGGHVRRYRGGSGSSGRGDGIHDPNWMQKQTGISSCSQMYASCLRGANKPGHGLAYPGVCEDRRNSCMSTGAWHTNNTGSRYGLARH